jgi:catechol 2,3-dioxygenase-like lactoylglutathione lyase family enzyme
VPWNKKAKKLVGVRTGVSFQVDDIERTYLGLKRKRVKFTLKPRKERWGGIVANFEDPDGNKFFLLQMPSGFAK